MPGFDRLLPGRKVVAEIISTGVAINTQNVTGVTSKYLTNRWQKWTGPFQPASTSNLFVLAFTASTSAGSITILAASTSAPIAQPDFPRVLGIAASTSQTATGNVVVIGTNYWGETVTDTIALGGAGAVTVNSGVAFKTITSVVLPASTSGTGTQAAYSVGIYLTKAFGLDRQIQTVGSCIRGVVNGTSETTAPIMSIVNHSASFSTAPTSSAGSTLEVTYIHADAKHS